MTKVTADACIRCQLFDSLRRDLSGSKLLDGYIADNVRVTTQQLLATARGSIADI